MRPMFRSRVLFASACFLALLGILPPSAAAQSGDINGDGHPDIIWQDVENGWVAAWLMNGHTVVDSILLYPYRVPPGTLSQPWWRVVGTGDANGDGKVDLFWQDHYSGYSAVWLMDGPTVSASELTGHQPNVTNDVMMVHDVNGDGRADMISHMEAGPQFSNVWLTGLSGPFTPAFGEVNEFGWEIPASMRRPWRMALAADFDGDGYKEYIWQNEFDGSLFVWRCEGTTVLEAFPLSIIAEPTWRLAGAADFNGDGNPDLLWQNEAYGFVAVSFMNGLSIVSSELIAVGRIQSNWRIVGGIHVSSF